MNCMVLGSQGKCGIVFKSVIMNAVTYTQMRFIPLVSSVPLSSLGTLITKQVYIVIYYHERIFPREDNSTAKMRLQNLVI